MASTDPLSLASLHPMKAVGAWKAFTEEKTMLFLQRRKTPAEFRTRVDLSGYRLNGWRWHHSSIARDLGRLISAIDRSPVKATDALRTNSASHVPSSLESFDFIIRENWKVHDRVERDIFFPWVRAAADREKHLSDRTLDITKKLLTFSNVAHKLANKAAAVRPHLRRFDDCRRDRPGQCEAEQRRAASNLRALRADAVRAFEIREETLIPVIKKAYSEREQERLGQKIIASLPFWSKVTCLVIFSEEIKLRGDKHEAARFYSSVPRSARLSIPLWKRNVYDGPTSMLRSGLH